MKKILFCFVLALLSCTDNVSDSFQLTEGVSEQLAAIRQRQVSDVAYTLSFDLPQSKEDAINSILNLELVIHHLKYPLYLDFKTTNKVPKLAVVNGKEISVEYTKEHLEIPIENLVLGSNTITIKFLAGETSLNRNNDFLFTLLVPDRARTLFPCFDQPNIKATYTLNIKAPKDWEVLAGASLAYKKETAHFTEHQFKESNPMSSYLFSFVAGKFEKIHATDTAYKMAMLHQEKNQDKIEISTPEIFQLHQKALNFLEEYTEYEFPFQKLDFATIFIHPYNGMEHVGAIQYRQSSLFLDKSATQSRELRRAKLISHETAHMWFGNLVTMRWFNDVWLKEVFANFMADKIIAPDFENIDHNLNFLVSHYPAAYQVDRSKGANPIRQKLDNLNNAGSLYGSIIYHKAPIMMRQLEALLGEDKFQEGIASYISKFANANADWNDLVEILDKKTALNLKEWSAVWVNSPGRPIITSDITYDKNNQIQSFFIKQTAEDATDKTWPQVFDVALVYPDSTYSLTATLKGQQIQLQAAIGLPKPRHILYNSNAYGYGVFPIHTAELKYAPYIEDEVARASCYLNSYENTLNGTISIDQAFELYKEGVHKETNELILLLISNQLTHIYWNYFTAEQRLAKQEQIEELLFSRLQSAEPSNIKKTLFGAFKNMAHSGIALKRLHKIWNSDLKIPNLILNQDDYTNIAMLLALYNHPDHKSILSKARSKLKDPNKLERFDFIRPALSQDKDLRINYFNSFAHKENREKENWVISASYYIHHPLRQNSAIETLELSLNLIEEIQKTGDIFFPKAWLDNTIGMYSSKEVLVLLEDFFKTHPNLNPQLKQKILQATNDLYTLQKLISTPNE